MARLRANNLSRGLRLQDLAALMNERSDQTDARTAEKVPGNHNIAFHGETPPKINTDETDPINTSAG